jgi:hypothetical protein
LGGERSAGARLFLEQGMWGLQGGEGGREGARRGRPGTCRGPAGRTLVGRAMPSSGVGRGNLPRCAPGRKHAPSSSRPAHRLKV